RGAGRARTAGQHHLRQCAQAARHPADQARRHPARGADRLPAQPDEIGGLRHPRDPRTGHRPRARGGVRADHAQPDVRLPGDRAGGEDHADRLDGRPGDELHHLRRRGVAGLDPVRGPGKDDRRESVIERARGHGRARGVHDDLWAMPAARRAARVHDRPIPRRETAMTARPLLLSLAIAATLAGSLALPSPAFAQDTAAAQAPASDKAARLDALYEQYWEELLELNPLQATFQGDNRYNDRLPDFYSAQFRAKSHEF